MRFKLSMKPRTLLNLIALLFFVIGLFTLLDEFFKRSNKYGDLSPNQLCYQWKLDMKNPSQSHETPDEQEIRNNLCNISETAQFKKFIWVVSDGWPRVFAEEVFQHFGEHSVGHSITVPGLKLSHSIYISWMTGEPSMMHWISQEIRSSSLFDGIFNAGFKINYVGKERSMLTLLGQSRRQRFSSIRLVEESSSTKKPIHSYLFENFDEILSDAVEEDRSIFAFSAMYDTMMHKLGYKNPSVEQLITDLNKNMQLFKDWIDAHPDYLLIISTDHGVDGFGNLLHGHTMKGNEGFILFYNPRLTHQAESPIDVVDVASTIAGYLQHVDIPATSVVYKLIGLMYQVGRTYTVFPESEHTRAYSQFLRQNLLQLLKLAKHQHVDVSYQVANAMDNIGNLNGDISEIEDAVAELKEKMYRISTLSFKTMFINVTGLLCALWFIISKKNTGLIMFFRHRNYIAAIQHIFYLILIYTLPLFSVWSLVLWHIEKRLDYNLATLSAFISPSFTVLMVKWIFTQDILITVNLLQNASLNGILIAVAYCFPKEVLINITKNIPTWVIYVLAGLGVNKVYPLMRTSPASNGHSFHNNTKLNKHRNKAYIYHFILFLMFLFELTAGVQSLYFILGFHVIAFHIYALLFIMIGLSFWRTSRKPVHVFVPLSLLLFFLLNRSNVDRLTLLLFNYHFLYLLDPLMKKLIKAEEQAPQISLGELLSQSGVMFVFNQILLYFTLGFQNNFDINVDPFTGKVGRITFDTFPLLSAFFMGYSKYGIFVLFAAFLWFSFGQSDKTYPFPLAVLLLNFTILNVIFHEMLWRYMMPDKFTDILINSTTFGTVALMYIGIDLLKRYVQRAPTHKPYLPMNDKANV